MPLPADGGGRRFALHVFLCTSDSACARDGPADEIRTHLKRRVREAGLAEEVRINQSGCLGQCGHGPMMVVYPEGIWYSHLTVEAADRIWEEHVLGGRSVEELRYRTPEGGRCVQPRDGQGRVDREHPGSTACSRC